MIPDRQLTQWSPFSTGFSVVPAQRGTVLIESAEEPGLPHRPTGTSPSASCGVSSTKAEVRGDSEIDALVLDEVDVELGRAVSDVFAGRAGIKDDADEHEVPPGARRAWTHRSDSIDLPSARTCGASIGQTHSPLSTRALLALEGDPYRAIDGLADVGRSAARILSRHARRSDRPK